MTGGGRQVAGEVYGRADPVVSLLWRESVVEARRHSPGGEHVDSDGAREKNKPTHSARSARMWPMIGPTRSLQAQRQRARRRPAAATATRNAGGVSRRCATSQH